MELDQFLFLLACFLFVMMLINTSTNYKTHRLKSHKQQLPPGPWKLPFIGSLHHLVGSSLPHHALRNLARVHGPLMHLQLGEVSTVVASSSQVAKEIMKTHDLNFSYRGQILTAKIITYGCVDLIFSPYGPYWRQLRKICMNELLGAKRVQSFEPIREEEVGCLLRTVSESHASMVNLSHLFLSFTNDVTARAAFGSKCRDREAFLAKMKQTVESTSGFELVDLFPSSFLMPMISGTQKKLETIHKELDVMLDEIVREHKEMMPYEEGHVEDLVDVLLRLQREGGLEYPLTDESVKAFILELFVAGSETSSTLLEWLMAELMKNPNVMKKAQAEVRKACRGKPDFGEKDVQELSYLKLVIKETLRLHPPAPLLIPRECGDTCEINGYEIPSKSKVIVNAWAIGRDPNIWDDAESFKPERFINLSVDFKGANFELIPFGAGRRMCPGIAFGLANIELPVAKLLYHFDWKLPPGVEPDCFDMSEKFGATTCKRTSLLLHATPYNSWSSM